MRRRLKSLRSRPKRTLSQIKLRIMEVEDLIIKHMKREPTLAQSQAPSRFQRLINRNRSKKARIYGVTELVEDLEFLVPEHPLLLEAVNRLIRKKILCVERDGKLKLSLTDPLS